MHYCKCVWDFFFTEKSIIYALIKYNKFKKNYTQQIKQISTNSFPIVEKKEKEMSLLPLKFYNCAKTIRKHE